MLYTAGGIGLVIFAIAANIIAFGHLLSPLRQHDEQHQPAAQEETSNGQGSPPSAAPLTSLELVEPESAQQVERAERRDSDDLRAQQTMAAAALVSLTLTGIGLIMIGRTLFYTRRAVDEAKEATKAASRGARAALRANEMFKETAKRELRAYVVTMFGGVSDVVAGKQVRARVAITNAGQTPAYELSRSIVTNLISPGPFKIEYPEIAHPREDFTIAPGSDYGVGANQVANFCLLQAGVDDLQAKKVALVVSGRVVYKDVFGDSHTTFFCHQYSGGKYSEEEGVYTHGGNKGD